ncbi:MAG: DUF899 domain-containing protein [Inquilinus sp.]|nr:DUF899 domain-containing protein [Inquilinus sp.]
MTDPKIVSHEQWLSARKSLLAREKEFTRQRDALSAERRAMPWVRIDKDYRFQSTDGELTLADLFDGRSQLIIYHFMYGPDWQDGCVSCSYMADGFNGIDSHLAQRDVAFAVVARAPIETLTDFRDRMGWDFRWVSSLGSDFNRDFGVTFTPEEIAAGEVDYNYRRQRFPADEAPGLSVFSRDDNGGLFHTYSTYGRGLDMLIGAYNFLDLVPKGRDEDALPWPMAWVRHHDRYEAT